MIPRLRKPPHMNKVIIVGRSASLTEEIEERLRRHGMNAPLPSRREGLLPQAVTTAICRAHQCPDARVPANAEDFKRISPSPVWNNLALDLLLGNQEQDLWGWADPMSIHLLDYWRELDPLALFVMVYDDAQQALQESGAAWPDEAGIRQCLNNWTAYNAAMLRFFRNHPDRCLLVNARQTRDDPDGFTGLLRAKLGGMTPSTHDSPSDSRKTVPATLKETLALATMDPTAALAALTDERAERFMLDHYLAEHPGCARFFEELQAASHLPLKPAPADAEVSCREAWQSFLAGRRVLEDVVTQLRRERSLLLAQLHQIQEELERVHVAPAVGETAPQPEPAKLLGAAERVKQQLSYRLGSTLVRNSRGIGGWVAMPFALLGEMLSYQRDRKNRGGQPLPPIHTYDDADEAERVKQHLSYRLGNALVKHARSPLGWIKLPAALRAEFKTFKQSRVRADGRPKAAA